MPLTNDASHRSWIALYRPAIRLSRLQRRERLSDSFFEINKKLCREKHSKLIGFETIFISYYIPLLFFFSFFFLRAINREQCCHFFRFESKVFSNLFHTFPSRVFKVSPETIFPVKTCTHIPTSESLSSEALEFLPDGTWPTSRVPCLDFSL